MLQPWCVCRGGGGALETREMQKFKRKAFYGIGPPFHCRWVGQQKVVGGFKSGKYGDMSIECQRKVVHTTTDSCLEVRGV